MVSVSVNTQRASKVPASPLSLRLAGLFLSVLPGAGRKARTFRNCQFKSVGIWSILIS